MNPLDLAFRQGREIAKAAKEAEREREAVRKLIEALQFENSLIIAALRAIEDQMNRLKSLSKDVLGGTLSLGFRPGEIPTILRKGEAILPRRVSKTGWFHRVWRRCIKVVRCR